MVGKDHDQENSSALIENVRQASRRLENEADLNQLVEQYGNYVPTILPCRYDALVYLNETQALHPLHIQVEEKETAPDTYPWGM